MRLFIRVFRQMCLLIVAAGLFACSVLPESHPQDIYRLPPTLIGASHGGTASITLRIARPYAGDLLDSTRIVVIPEGDRLSVYKGARWSSPAPILWRDHLLDAFRSDGRIARISSAPEGLRADVELGGTLRAFQAEYNAGAPEVVIRLDAHLVDTTDRNIIASRRFTVREAVDGEQLPAVVEAFGRANDALARKLIDWTLLSVE